MKLLVTLCIFCFLISKIANSQKISDFQKREYGIFKVKTPMKGYSLIRYISGYKYRDVFCSCDGLFCFAFNAGIFQKKGNSCTNTNLGKEELLQEVFINPFESTKVASK